MKVQNLSNFDLFDTCAPADTWCHEMKNEYIYYYLRSLLEKSGNIKENLNSKNIIFLRFAFFEKIKSVQN